MNPIHRTNTTTDDAGDAGELQQWIDGLLQSGDATALESAPATTRLAATTAIQQFRHRRRRRRSLAIFAAAAAIAGVMATSPNTPLPRREGTGEGLATPLATHAPEAPATANNPSPSPSLQGRGIRQATFVADRGAIAVPLTSPAPDVTVVQLYPTVDAQRHWQRQIALQRTLVEPNGG